MGVSINNFGPEAKLEVAVRIKGQGEWEPTVEGSAGDSQIEYVSEEEKYLTVGESFTGVVHSVEVTTSDGALAIDKQKILGKG